MRIKITVNAHYYATERRSFITEPLGEAALYEMLSQTSKMQAVETKTIGEEKFLVTEATEVVAVEVVSDDYVLNRKQFAEKQAAHAQELANKQQKLAEKAKQEAEAI